MLNYLTGLGEETLAYAVIVLVVGVLGQLLVAGMRNASAQKIAAIDATQVLKRHTDEIAIQLLSQLRLELTRLAEENARLLPYVQRATSLATLLEDILSSGTPEIRKFAEQTARAYLDHNPLT